MLNYVWTDRHRDAKDSILSRRVILLRLTFALFVGAFVISRIAG